MGSGVESLQNGAFVPSGIEHCWRSVLRSNRWPGNSGVAILETVSLLEKKKDRIYRGRKADDTSNRSKSRSWTNKYEGKPHNDVVVSKP